MVDQYFCFHIKQGCLHYISVDYIIFSLYFRNVKKAQLKKMYFTSRIISLYELTTGAQHLILVFIFSIHLWVSLLQRCQSNAQESFWPTCEKCMHDRHDVTDVYNAIVCYVLLEGECTFQET